MHLIAILILGFFLWAPQAISAFLSEENQIKHDLQQAQEDNTMPGHRAIIASLQSALNSIAESKASMNKITEYQHTINNFPILTRELIDAKKESELSVPDKVAQKLTSTELNHKIVQTKIQLINLAAQLQQEQDLYRLISDSLEFLPQQQAKARKDLNNQEQKLQSQTKPWTIVEKAYNTALRAEQTAIRLKVNELDLAQLSAIHRQELSRLRIELLKKRYDQIDQDLQFLRNQLNSKRQQEAEQALEHTEILVEQSASLPKLIINQLQVNRELSIAINQQAKHMDSIASQQGQAASQILQVQQALKTLRDQAKWLGESPALGETLRAQISSLPDRPKQQQLDSDMAQLRVMRLYYADMMNKLPQQLLQVKKTDNGIAFTPSQIKIIEDQLATKRTLLSSLLSGCDTQILELTKLKVANSQLEEAINEINEAVHRYLFWVADVSQLSLSYPLYVWHDLCRLISVNTLHQITSALSMILMNQKILIQLFGSLILVGFGISSSHHYHSFLKRSSSIIGKVNQDHFWLTMKTVLWSILMALPLPILWSTVGYSLRHAWPYPTVVAIGNGVTTTLPVLCVFMVISKFASPYGLFITHFGWPVNKVVLALRYYTLAIWIIVPLIMALITFDNPSNREFAGTLGRLCFIILCACMSMITNSLKRAGLPLHLDKYSSGNDIVNSSLWNLMICAPIIASILSCLGYLATAKALLARLETSVSIWFLLFIIYHIIRRWMFIQRRRIAFERAKQRRSDTISQRACYDEDRSLSNQVQEITTDIDDEKLLDLDTISAQSLQLVRSILTLIALLSVILLWSEIHFAFGFLEKITLWDVTSSIQGVDGVQPITLGAVLIAILVFIITTQMVRNLPALLELALLQHLNLTPGNSYAITTMTKYGLMLLGGFIGFSFIGIEWAKLQWLVAAIGVGLGFGLQAIFANFISGLMILFEKPIRIGDTVTIRNLTGNITHINIRATTITDFDRKEIIVPNQAFITEQFINWSLSDTITRVVINIPAPDGANIETITNMLMQAALQCPLVLRIPAPEAYLVDLQHGLPLFELRMYTSEMGHRMPLRHQVNALILESYRANKLLLPYPPFQIRTNQQHNNDIITPNNNNYESI